jgi:hypothetical protein
MKRKLVLATMSSSFIAGTASAAVSREASFLGEQLEKPRLALQTTETFGHAALTDALDELADGCAAPNWDGHGAEPLSTDTIEEARRVIASLPLGTARPEIGIEPDGQITLEWYRSPRFVLSISISPQAELHYAALLGPTRRYGTEPFFGELPPAILDLISTVTAA